jgi:hypothetical protein
MAIGTTVKVGFDGEEVKRGFAGLKNGFSAIGRTMGKGAALVGGMMAAQTLEGIIIKAATGTNELADFAGAAEDVALQTGSTVSEIIRLNRALELAGAQVDAGRMLSTLADNMYDATHGGTELQNTFAKIGLSAAELAQMKPIDQFKTIMQTLAQYQGSIGELSDITETIFGAKMGMQIIRLFKNADVMTNQMGADVAAFAKNVENSAGKLGSFSDQVSRLKYLWRSLNLAGFELFGGNGEYMKALFDTLDDLINFREFAKVGAVLKAEFAKALEVFNESAFMDTIRNAIKSLGDAFGEGFKDSIKGSLPFLSSVSNPFGGSKDTSTTQLLHEMQKSNGYLASIERTNGTYA